MPVDSFRIVNWSVVVRLAIGYDPGIVSTNNDCSCVPSKEY